MNITEEPPFIGMTRRKPEDCQTVALASLTRRGTKVEPPTSGGGQVMIVDCTTCPVRGQRCDGCVATVLLDPGPAELPLDAEERRAVSALVGAGLASVETAAGLFARYEPRHWVDPTQPMELRRVAGSLG